MNSAGQEEEVAPANEDTAGGSLVVDGAGLEAHAGNSVTLRVG